MPRTESFPLPPAILSGKASMRSPESSMAWRPFPFTTPWSSDWAGAPDADTSWRSFSTDGYYLYALRADGRVDRATIGGTPSWSEPHGDAGTGSTFAGIDNPIPEFISVVLPPLSVILIFLYKRRRKECHKR